MANAFSKMVDFLNKPLPGAPATTEKGKAEKAEKKAEKEAAKTGAGVVVPDPELAEKAEAVDVQAELIKKDAEIKELQRELKQEEQRKELEARREELLQIRREYEKEVAEEAKAHAETEDWTYTVQSGDSLWKISERFYGNGARWNEIYDANTDKIENPSLIYPGQTFVIPNVD